MAAFRLQCGLLLAGDFVIAAPAQDPAGANSARLDAGPLRTDEALDFVWCDERR